MDDKAISGIAPEDEYRSARERMIKSQLIPRGISDLRVLTAMEKIHRHRFVPRYRADEAYEDRPLPIDYGQTIS